MENLLREDKKGMGEFKDKMVEAKTKNKKLYK